ncbi:MAG: lysylphosphatidylglycerol synthase domain-containing protein [Acetobacteraceae bacterium]
MTRTRPLPFTAASSSVNIGVVLLYSGPTGSGVEAGLASAGAQLRTRTLSIAAALAGLAGSTVLIAWFGFHRVLSAALSVGWHGFAILILWQGVVFALLGLAWWTLVPRRPALGLLVWARMVRDATSNCLPLSAVGGFVFGARVANMGGLTWPMASASTLADVTTEFLSQLVFAGGGLAFLVVDHPGSPLALPFSIGIGLGVFGAIAFIGLQHGSAGLAERFGRRFGAAWMSGLAARIGLMQREIHLIYANRILFAAASLLHLGAWIANGVGSWFIMRLIGADIGLPAALAIEGLLQAALTVAFAVPGFAGVQELAYVGLGGIFGLPADAAIAVSLVRRARDLAIGVPVLLTWQLCEARRLEPGSAPGGEQSCKPAKRQAE